ncbi:TetR family transcriptional regulator [Tsukamurella sp. 1534]|uniref:TetR family transcriptional regulator n=1 Tax=Tsukamurella sp. 1534 TaxID=1151061 RepID=UPI00031F00A4|nr:TetR family transcriptional regulator [Tsukamurella sp. 1534]
MQNDVRDRSREILRAELADAAATFCVEHGFDNVTANELARGIGVSRATFFRYFASKEDAVVSAARFAATRAGSFAQSVAEAVEAAAPGTGVWVVMRAATEPMVATAESRGDPLRARIRMINEVPALKGHLASQQRGDQSAVADVLGARLGDVRVARALAAAGVAAVDFAWHEWAFTPGSRLRPLFDAYFAALSDIATPKVD